MKPAQYNPETAPVLDLIGYGYRPAWMPADYIGPPPGLSYVGAGPGC
mgnify:CR=1 FL=1